MQKLLLCLGFIMISCLVSADDFRPSFKGSVVEINPKQFGPRDKVTVYVQAKKSKELINGRKKIVKKRPTVSLYPERIFLHFGYNNWTRELTVLDNQEPEMKYDRDIDCWYIELDVPETANQLNITFKDDLDNWDNNYGRDYVFGGNSDKVAPAPVKITKLVPAAGDFYFEWEYNNEEDFSGYIVYKNNKRINTDIIRSNSFRDTDVVEGREYNYKITAIDTYGNESEAVEHNLVAMKNIINLPEIDNLTGVLANKELKLIANMDDIYEWKLEIKTENNDTIRVYKGKGSKVMQIWDFKNEEGVLVKPGDYKYIVSIGGGKIVLPRELKIRVIE